MKQILFLLLFLLGTSASFAEQKDNIDMYPQAKEGFTRYVIEVPETPNDYSHKLELRIGKMALVDCNYHRYHGKVEAVPLKGWGYTYLEVAKIDEGRTTMMACSEPKREKFVFLRDELRRYNSRSPLVVYVPQGYEVRYHIWSADETAHKAEQR